MSSAGSIVRGRDLTGDLSLTVDAVVVGTGAGGSIAFRELARAGLDVVALEEGGFHTSADFNQREEQMFPLLFQDGGGRMTKDLAIRVLQGRGVGGSTIHNTNLCKRTPDEILDLWKRKYHVSDAAPSDMRSSFETIERDLSVAMMPDAYRNKNNDALRRGCEALGWRGGMLAHNRKGCQLSGFCELGCAYDAKENALKIVIPQGVAAGGRVMADVRATKIVTRGGDVIGVEAIAMDADGNARAHVNVKAKVVVLSASAVGSAALAIASGLPDPNAQLGRGLRMHPGAVAAGIFDEVIAGDQGIPQSYECMEFLSFEEGAEKRTWIIPAFAHPIGTASTLPGFGADHMRAMRNYEHLAVFTAMLHDETSGRVDVDGDRPVIAYEMNEADRTALAKGLVACARLLFAAGAREVTIPSIFPVRMTSARDLDRLDTSFVAPHSVPLSAVHPMGTMRMGDNPRSSVVRSTGEHHQVRGLFVMDGSLFPTSLGGPPQNQYLCLRPAPRAACDRRVQALGGDLTKKEPARIIASLPFEIGDFMTMRGWWVALAIGLGACSNNPGGPSTGDTVTVSCDLASGGTHICIDYQDIPTASVASVQSTCTGEGGSVVAGGCPHAGTGGGCYTPMDHDAGSDVPIVTWDYNNETPTQTMMDCAEQNATYVGP